MRQRWCYAKAMLENSRQRLWLVRDSNYELRRYNSWQLASSHRRRRRPVHVQLLSNVEELQTARNATVEANEQQSYLLSTFRDCDVYIHSQLNLLV